MNVVAMPSRKKSWQTGRQRVSVEAALAIQRENVMQRLVRLRVEIGHPEKQGEPLPQDQAAQRAGVTARQWQRWESGASVPYARNLSAVADAFGFDVAEFYDGPAGQKAAGTPDPFPVLGVDEQLARMERRLAGLIETQNDLLARQSKILEGIEAAIRRDEEAAQARVAAEDEWVDRVVSRAREALAGDAQSPGSARRKRAKSATPRG